MRSPREKSASMRRAKRGNIGAYIDAEALGRVSRVLRAVSYVLAGAIAQRLIVQYAYTAVVARFAASGAWLIFVSNFVLFAVAIALVLSFSVWLTLWSARRGCKPATRPM
jgi:hypothetical protein